jgi:hypothetical protein
VENEPSRLLLGSDMEIDRQRSNLKESAELLRLPLRRFSAEKKRRRRREIKFCRRKETLKPENLPNYGKVTISGNSRIISVNYATD